MLFSYILVGNIADVTFLALKNIPQSLVNASWFLISSCRLSWSFSLFVDSHLQSLTEDFTASRRSDVMTSLKIPKPFARGKLEVANRRKNNIMAKNKTKKPNNQHFTEN